MKEALKIVLELAQQNVIDPEGEPFLEDYRARQQAAIDEVEKLGDIHEALVTLTRFCLSGDRYERRNPYTIPEIRLALYALGFYPPENNNLIS